MTVRSHRSRPSTGSRRLGLEVLESRELLSGPTITTPAAASPSPVVGLTTQLSVLASESGVTAANLAYSWQVSTEPTAATPTLTTPHTNSTSVTFNKSGSYTFKVTVTDPSSHTASSSVNVVVSQTLTSLTLTPPSVSLVEGSSQQFVAAGKDQFGATITTLPTMTWSVLGGVGSITQSGTYTAGAVVGSAKVEATAAGVAATAAVTVTAPPIAAATATLSPAGVLTVTGGGGPGDILFFQDSNNGQNLLWIEGIPISVNGVSQPTVAASAVTSIVVQGLGPNDDVDLSGGTLGTAPVTIPTTIIGGAGAERLIGGAGNDTITGGSGPDIIDGGAGTNTLTGGSGPSTFVSHSTTDTITSGTGTNSTTTVLSGFRTLSDVIDYDGTQQATVYIPAGLDPTKKYPVLFYFSPVAGTQSVLQAAADREKFVYVAFNTDLTVISTNQEAAFFEADITALGAALPYVDTTKVLLSGLSAGAKFANLLNIFPEDLGLSQNPGWDDGTLEQSDSLQSVLNDNGWTAADLPTNVPPGRIAMIVWPADMTNGHPIGQEVLSDKTTLYPQLGFAVDYQEYGGGHSTQPPLDYDQALQWLLQANPLIAAPATASTSVITGNTVNLSVVADDAAGDTTPGYTGADNLTYSWSELSGPGGVTFSASGTNAAKACTATFAAAGNYVFCVTVTDASGLSSTSDVAVTVQQTLTSLSLSPATVTVGTGSTQQFTASGLDQFGAGLATLPTLNWSLLSGGVGSINQSGSYSAGTVGGSATLEVSAAGVTATATVTVPAPPTLTSISPASVTVGSPPTTLTLTGSSFNSSTVITFNGSTLAPATETTTQLTVVVPAADLTTVGTDPITVTTNAGTSTPVNFIVTLPAPTLTGLSPTSIAADSPATTLTLTGTNFDSSAIVSFNSTTLTPTAQTPTQLTVVIPAADLTTATADTVSVTTNAGTSASQTIPVTPIIAGGVLINGGGTGNVQRSLVTRLTVTFSGPVTLAPGAFTLTRQSDGSSITSGTTGNILVGTTDNQTFVLTFTTAANPAIVQNGSLADGVYVLNINHLLVTGGTTGTGPTMAADYNSPTAGAARIDRLFGDFNGDGSVNGADFSAFAAADNAGPNDPNYQSDFDFSNSDQAITSADFTQFSDRYGESL